VHREIKKISSAATVVDRRLECVTLAESLGWAGHLCPFQELSASRAAGRTRTNKKHGAAQFHLKPVPTLVARFGRGMLMKFILEISLPSLLKRARWPRRTMDISIARCHRAVPDAFVIFSAQRPIHQSDPI